MLLKNIQYKRSNMVNSNSQKEKNIYFGFSYK